MKRTSLFVVAIFLLLTTVPARADRVCAYGPDDPFTLQVVNRKLSRGRTKVAVGGVFVATGLVVLLSLGGTAAWAKANERSVTDGDLMALIFGPTSVLLGGLFISSGAPLLAKGLEDQRDAEAIRGAGLRVAF